MRRNYIPISDERLAMCRHLFSIDRDALSPVSDDSLWRMLHELRSAPELERFGLYLVGSRLEPGRDSADIDLVISPKPGSAFSDIRIERALWCCREYGLHRARTRCLIDAAFRREGPSFTLEPLDPERILQTAKLFSPKIALLIRDGRITRYRQFGRFSIEYWRTAGETGFYQKLPQLALEKGTRYFRPAVPVTNHLSTNQTAQSR